MSADHAFKKVIWAVDFLTEMPELEKQALAVLKVLDKSLNLEIQPVFVASSHPTLQKYLPTIIDEIGKRFAKYKCAALKPPIAIGEALNIADGTKDEVDALIKYAVKAQGDLIMVQTKASKGIKKFLLGSFAETLIMHSSLPVMTVNPNSSAPRSLKKILFPFDLEEGSRQAFVKVARLAKPLGAKVTLYHRLEAPSHYLGPYAHLMQEEYRLDKQDALKAAQDLVSVADAIGVKTEIIIESKKARPSDSIVSYADKNDITLIAMDTEKEEASAFLLGSTGRDVIRKSDVPVWIVHS